MIYSSQELENNTVHNDRDISMLKIDMKTSNMNFLLMQRRLNDMPLRVSECKYSECLNFGYLLHKIEILLIGEIKVKQEVSFFNS